MRNNKNYIHLRALSQFVVESEKKGAICSLSNVNNVSFISIILLRERLSSAGDFHAISYVSLSWDQEDQNANTSYSCII